ncbi:hypothetical protein BDF20DRAFT_899482 [Mycotypha africana]|uniref:uncharacterized protein n=1 Tax=Mycotypha africana TaxID=64632 RepID=UPI002301C674|nr:uncharacterized protein BDF20DRAFT_899482 [Mycotypha africana]KAI8967830.1 hypothetical protein BDF20DRAFT_899482 [Mycotypha africana]
MADDDRDTQQLAERLKDTSIKEGILVDVESTEDKESTPTVNVGADLDQHPSKEIPSAEAQQAASYVQNQEQTTTTSRQFQTDVPTFDFHRFLEQMKDPSAAPIARYTKGFIAAFHRREAWTVNEQIKFIQDYLNFTYGKMRDCDVWRDISEKEFENAKEGMEKLVMNRLYNVTFSPRTMDDKEKDNILHHKIKIFRWIREEHLDIPVTADNPSFLTFAEAELLKINNYKAPRDKLICILNCCKVIFGLIKHMNVNEGGADIFLPLLIYVVIRANPPRLISNVQYISRFRNPEHLKAEAGYYLTNLMGAIEFIQTMDVNSLTISKEQFDANIENTMAALEQEESQGVLEKDKKQVSYDNVLHPRHAKKQPQQQPLMDLGSDITQKSKQLVEKLFSDSHPPSDSDTGVASSSSRQVYPSSPPPPRSPSQGQSTPQRANSPFYVPNDPSSLSQELPVPSTMAAPEGAVASPRPLSDDEARKEFDENLSTIVQMFPNIEPGVCFMILQASKGKLPQTIESLLDISNEQN